MAPKAKLRRDRLGRFRERDSAFPAAAVAVAIGFVVLLFSDAFRESILAFLTSLPVWLLIAAVALLALYIFGRRG